MLSNLDQLIQRPSAMIRSLSETLCVTPIWTQFGRLASATPLKPRNVSVGRSRS